MPLIRAWIAEAVGTFLLVLFGTGVVAAAVMTGAQMGLWQVAAVWAVGVAVAIYAASHISGAHLNPAVSLAFAIFRGRDFPARRLPFYWSAQLAGAVLAGLAVLVVFGSSISRFEESRDIVRGEPGSQLSAMAFGEYFPNPDIVGVDQEARRLISSGGAVSSRPSGPAYSCSSYSRSQTGDAPSSPPAT